MVYTSSLTNGSNRVTKTPLLLLASTLRLPLLVALFLNAKRTIQIYDDESLPSKLGWERPGVIENKVVDLSSCAL